VSSRFSLFCRIILCVVFFAGVARAADPPITSIAFAPDGKSVVVCSQAGLRVYSWPGLKMHKKLKVSAPNLHDVAFSPSGNRLALAGGAPAVEGTVEIFSWPEGKLLKRLSGHEDSVMAIAWRDKSTIGSASLDHNIALWNTDTGKRIRELKGHSRGVSTICFLAKENILVSAGIDQNLRVWKSESGNLIRSLAMHTLPVNNIALRPNQNGLALLASASDDRSVRFWQPTIGRMVRFARLESKPLDVQWLPDGSKLLACCTNGHIYLIDPDTAEVIQDIPAIKGWAYSLAVHPTDGSVLVGGSDGQLRRVAIKKLDKK
jgi:WD40 repeat protein